MRVGWELSDRKLASFFFNLKGVESKMGVQ